MIGLKDIEEARSRIDDFVDTTPCARSETFSKLCGAATWFKLENLQMTGSFKERGALNRLATLTPEERARGVVAASAGNHAQAVAYHAGRLGIAASIVMPERTPLIKVQNTRTYGAKVELQGCGVDDALARAQEIREATGAVLVPPFDDDHIIAGQGTIGLELLEQNPYLQVVLVPVGGGGLIAGLATAIKEVNPRIQVIGVESAAFPAMKRSVEAGRPVTMEPARTLADGIAVKRPSERTLAAVQKYVDDLVLVDEEEIASAILLLLEREKTVVEGAGAVGLAALANGKVPQALGKKVAVILSGGNIDVNTLARIIDRGLAKDGRLVRLLGRVDDRPGALASFLAVFAEGGANVMEVHHQRAFATHAAVGETEIEVTIETRGTEHGQEILAALEDRGYRVHVVR